MVASKVKGRIEFGRENTHPVLKRPIFFSLTIPAWLILLGVGVLAITALMSCLATISCSRRSYSVFFQLQFLRCPRYLKGTQSALDSNNLDTSFATLKSVYLNPKSNARVGYI